MTDYYVDPVNGLDTNAGTPLITDAWKTFQKALDTVTAGNDIYLMNTGTESPTARINIDTNASAITTQINVYGADGSGDRLDGTGKYTISGDNIAGTFILSAAVSNNYITLHDISFIDSQSTGVNVSTGNNFVTLVRCSVSGSASRGIAHAVATGIITLIDCDIFGCTSDGMRGAATRGNFHSYASKYHDNGASGVITSGDFSGFSIFRNNSIYDNVAVGIVTGADAYLSLVGNTVYGNGSSGVSLSTSHAWIFSNTFASSGGSGIDFVTNPAIAIDYNHYDNNTGTEWAGTGAPATTSNELNKQTGDPLFTSVVDGSEDFTPLTGSPLLDNALASGRDIGAIEMPGAGGSSWWQDWA